MTDQEIVAVVQAKMRGEKIQGRLLAPLEQWKDDTAPLWAFNYWEYRVKPEPRACYIIERKGSLVSGPYTSKCDADNAAITYRGRVVKFVEELE